MYTGLISQDETARKLAQATNEQDHAHGMLLQAYSDIRLQRDAVPADYADYLHLLRDNAERLLKTVQAFEKEASKRN